MFTDYICNLIYIYSLITDDILIPLSTAVINYSK